MNKKYDPVIDFESFHKWRDDFSRGIQDVVDADSREQMGKNVGAVLTRSLDAIFEHAVPTQAGKTGAASPAASDAADETFSWAPCANCLEAEEGYVVEMELAGVSLEQVNVEISGSRLIVSGQARDNVAAAQASHANPAFNSTGFNKTERRLGRFERIVELPADADIEAVDASMENGLLTVRIARQNLNRRRVKVELKPG